MFLNWVITVLQSSLQQDSTLQARFGSCGSAPSQLCNPSFLTINNNLVYVSEEGNRVSVFDTKGTFFHCFGESGYNIFQQLFQRLSIIWYNNKYKW